MHYANKKENIILRPVQRLICVQIQDNSQIIFICEKLANEKQEGELKSEKTNFSHRSFFPGYFPIIKKPCNSIWQRKYNTHDDFSWSEIEIKNKNRQTA